MNETNELQGNYESEEGSSERKIVVPGEIIVSGDDFLPGDGTRREGENVVANRYGLSEKIGRVVKIIPLSGAFVPRRNNIVLGRVTDILHSGWLVDIDAASNSFLPLAETPRFINKHEMDQFLAIGDMVAAKIWNTTSKSIDLAMKGKGLGKLEGGFVFKINASRVPRVIGREGSMINLIKENTGCNVTIGQNGWVWISGQDVDSEIRARKAIEFIADKVYVHGLTEKMEEWFSKYK